MNEPESHRALYYSFHIKCCAKYKPLLASGLKTVE